MSSDDTGRDCNNPNRGREAYVSGVYPCAFQSPKGQLQKVEIPDEPDPEDPVTYPDCVYSDGEYYEYNDATGSYVGDEGSLGTFNSVIGWIFTVDGIDYSATNNGTDPYGVYESADSAICVISCDLVPDAPMDQCVAIKLAAEGIELDTFTNQSTIAYSGDTQGGTLIYSGNWEYTVAGVTYTGPSDQDDPKGVYDDGSGNCLIIGSCE